MDMKEVEKILEGISIKARGVPQGCGLCRLLVGFCGGGGFGGYRMASMKPVSSEWMSSLMKDISLRVFSKMTRGSSDWQRRQLGAITMARLFTSIFVTDTLDGCANTCGAVAACQGAMDDGQFCSKIPPHTHFLNFDPPPCMLTICDGVRARTCRKRMR